MTAFLLTLALFLVSVAFLSVALAGGRRRPPKGCGNAHGDCKGCADLPPDPKPRG